MLLRSTKKDSLVKSFNLLYQNQSKNSQYFFHVHQYLHKHSVKSTISNYKKPPQYVQLYKREVVEGCDKLVDPWEVNQLTVHKIIHAVAVYVNICYN